MGFIFLRAGAWCARFYEGGKRRNQKLAARSRKDAAAELAEMEARIAKGLPSVLAPAPRAEPTNPDITVRALVAKFCDEYQTTTLADVNEYRKQARSLLGRHVTPALGHIVARFVQRRDVVQLRDDLLARKVGVRTVEKTLTQLGRVFSWAIYDRELWTGNNPCSRVKRPKSEAVSDYYTEAEVAQLFDWAARHNAATHAVLATAFYTGMRRGELAALRWGDIDFDGGRVLVQRSWTRKARKSGKPVVVALHPHLSAILAAQLEASGLEQDAVRDSLVHPAPDGGMRKRYHTWADVKAALDGAAVRSFKHPLHALRHTHATTLAQRGAGLGEIRDALGQSSLYMASRYAHTAAESIRKRIESLPTIGPSSSSNVASIGSARQKGSLNARADRQRSQQTVRSQNGGE